MKRNFTLGLAVSVLMTLMTVVVNAQDVDNPWHLVAFENDVEVAFYNTEMITGIEATAQNVTIALDNGKTFSHPVATTTFGFDSRKDGTGTSNEAITTLGWCVSYTNNRLHFSKPVSDVCVFNMYGALEAQFAGIFTEVPVNLDQGLYVVHAEGKSAKLFVNNSGNGRAPAQPLLDSQPVANASNTVTLRAGDIKIYWNITASNSTMSVEIPNVQKFYFTVDNSIVFTLTNGNTIELADYQGIEFAVEPAKETSSKWNMDLTMKLGGAAYGVDSSLPYGQWTSPLYVTAFTTTEIICYDVQNKVERKYPIQFIPNFEARFTMYTHPVRGLLPVYDYAGFWGTNPYMYHVSIENGDEIGFTGSDLYKGNTSFIATTFYSIDNGNLKAVFEEGEYIFK